MNIIPILSTGLYLISNFKDINIFLINPHSIILTIYYIIYALFLLYLVFKNKKTIYSNALSKELAKQIIEVAKEDDGMIQYMTEKDSIVREDQITHMSDFHMGIYQPMYLKIAKRVKDMNIESENHDSIPKMYVPI